MINLIKGKASKDKRNDSQDPAVNAAALEDVGAVSAQTSQNDPQQHQQAQEVIDMMVRKHHERHPHSKDLDREISPNHPGITEQGAGEDEDDEDGMFKFAPPQSGEGEHQPATEPLQPLPSTPPSGVSASHSQQHNDNVYPPYSVLSSALDPHSHIDATASDDGLSPAARYAQQVQSNRPATAISTKSGLGKRRQPFVYPGSPIYTTAGGGHQQHYNHQEHLNEHDLPMAQREGTPVIGMADGSGFPVSVQGTPRSAFLPEYKSQLDDGEDGYSQRTGGSSFMTKARSRSLKAGKGSGGMAIVQEWNGQDSPDLYKLNEYAMQDLSRDGGNTTAIPTSRGGESHRSPSIGYTASRRPMTAALSSRGATAISAIDGDKHSISGYDLYEGVDEDSPFPEVRASVSNIDDPEMPVLTFRSWFLGIFFLILGGCLNFFFNIRFPSPLISPVTVQLLSYPFGKLLSYTLPTKSVKTPAFLRSIGFPEDLSLNPGPFNIKEHTIVVMIANVTLSPPYALNLTLVLDRFYQQPKGIGFDFLIVISTQIIGFSFAGLCRRYLVWPGSMVWPQNLVTCTLFNTFHAEDDDGSDGSLTRFRYFTYVIIAGFLWFLLPGYLFTGLSVFSYICWIFPRQKVVNQLFGISTGLGMSGITFDWAQIAYTGSPLVVPWFAAVNIFAGFCIIYWVIVPALYYTNVWNFAYMPISVSGNFDRFGQYYNVSMVTNDDMSFNQEKYEAYSPLFMSTTYAIVYGISFCLATASIMHVLLYSGKDIYQKFRKTAAEDEDVHMKLMRNYPEVADWWYWLVFLVCTVLAIIAVELTVNLVSEVIPGYALPGRPVANMLFKAFSVQGLQSGLYFVQDLKLGHYMKIPPRASFIAQIVGITISCFVQVGMKRAMESLVPDLCADDQHALLVCPISHVAFEASVIWGLIGPERFFGHGSPYRPLLYLLLLGVVLPIPFFFMARKWPESWVRHINIPVMLNGATWIPPATGINYSSWFLVSAVFQFWLRRRRFRWWSKFNFVTSCALEAGTILSALFIFFALQLPREGTIELKWWGNEVYKRTADWVGVPYRDTPEAGFGPESWY